MTQETITLINIKPEEGKWLYNGQVFSKEVLLGVNDSPSNWLEVTDEEKSNIETTWEDVE